MFNTLVLVGRVVEKPEKINLETGQKMAILKLAVQRAFKNHKGEYDVDFFNILLWEGLTEAACEYCTKGSVVGVKGRIQVRTTDLVVKEETLKINNVEVIGEKIHFIHLIKEKEDGEK